MLANYYKTAVRNLARSRFYAFINIFGLSVGIAFTLLIAAYCWSESRVNHQLRNAGRQYILTSEWKNPAMGYPVATLGQLARALKENYPTLVANYYRFDGITVVASYGDKHFREGLQVGDSTLLAMYGFSLLQGDARTALNNPFCAAITDEKAIKFFGTTDAVGKNLTIDNFAGQKQDFRITAVLKKPARNSVTQLVSTFENGIFVPASNLGYFGRNMDWANVSIANYVELQPEVHPESLQGPIERLVRMNCSPQIAANLHVRVEPLTSFYLSAFGGSVQKMLYTLSFIAVFILSMAIINFINLSVSRSTARMREIGIRKVLGGLRRQLRVQFLTESILVALASTVIALILYMVLAPFLAGILGSKIPALSAMPAAGWLVIVLFALVTGWLAGLYPAVLLSSLSSVEALKGRAGAVRENLRLRKTLVGLQFGAAVVVFTGALIVSWQIDLFFSDRLGYNKEYILSSQLPRDWSTQGVQRMETIRAVFAGMSNVKDAALSYEIPNGMNGGNINAYREGGDSTRPVVAQSLVTDAHYASTYQIPLAAGVFFHAAGESGDNDSTRLVLNETAVKALGWNTPVEAVGQRMRLVGFTGKVFTISGVVKDFHFDAMGAPIQPEVFGPVSLMRTYRYFSFKLNPGNIPASISALQRQWARLMPGAPFEYRFMDENLQAVYYTELRLREAASMATGVAFVIVLLGVVGLVANSVRRRTKEIAIRKVIGASAPGIVRLFIRDYLPVLLVAGVVASPFAYWIMHRWLDNYATRITITVWPFVLAIGCLAGVMVLLIAVQTIRAALANPVKALRSE
ncbi:ABC transporter permease [Puia dinghuensis]|uniref:ABC transporter permease n=1 Tax=Puia dinghuensis TaxID=1792502 RepID=A0A8J2XPV0_9BACT|nr:ABC transporter permease [Puia dinghuensis]GGA82683.1 ABC transporter permease [Puia dinghuensis]